MYGRNLAALLAALGALGTSSYYIANGISGGGGTNAAAPIASTSTSAAAVLEEPATQATATGGRCGRERWSVKTLTDPDAASINLTPIPSTITALGSVAAPKVTSDLPRQPQEKNVYRVEGTIVAYK